MEANDIINLVKAGFSKEDILKMFPETPPAQNPPAQNPPAQNPPAQNPPAQNPPAQNPSANDQTTETIKNLPSQVTTLTEIIKTMQSDAIKNAGGGKPETKTSLDVVKDFFGQPTK